jgi:hypothetical protein
MATPPVTTYEIIEDAYVYLGGQTLSASATMTNVEFAVTVDVLETTGIASQGWKQRTRSLRDGSLKLSVYNDQTGGIDAFLWSNLGAKLAFEVRRSSASPSASNPRWTGTVLINSYSPLRGKSGDASSFDVTFPTDGAIIKSTS